MTEAPQNIGSREAAVPAEPVVKRRSLVFPLTVVGGLILVTPIALVRQWEIGRRPVVTASASGQHVIVANKKGAPNIVVATVEFDRPTKDGRSVHCTIDDQEVGRPSDPKAFSVSIRLAVRLTPAMTR
jgi:hypothetical protein